MLLMLAAEVSWPDVVYGLGIMAGVCFMAWLWLR